LIRAGVAALGMLVAVMLVGHAWAQSGEPIKIGGSMSLTGGLAPDGRSSAARTEIWEEETNARNAWSTHEGIWMVVAAHNGRLYLKTEADGYAPNNLLNLAPCP
jgi:hypothetical protein